MIRLAEVVGASHVRNAAGKANREAVRVRFEPQISRGAQLPEHGCAFGPVTVVAQFPAVLGDDLELATLLKQWITESQTAPRVSQTADVPRDSNKVTLIAGSGNSVN